MRVLFTCQPALGHFHPLAPIAQALEAAGHDVAFACAPSFALTVSTSGFRCFPVGLDWLVADIPRAFPQYAEKATLPLMERLAWINEEVFAGAVAQRVAADLTKLHRDWRFDAVVRDLNEFGGYVAAEALGLPHVTVQVSAFQPFYWRDDALSRQLDRWRIAYGLPPDPGLTRLYHYLYLSCEPPGIPEPNVGLPQTTHSIQVPPYDRSDGDVLPPWVEHLPDRPTVYVTFGTIANRRPGIFEAVLDALQGLDLNLIVTVGPNRDPADLGPRPPNVYVERYVPQTLLFPRCDLVVCHGGRNTVLAALGHGLPMLLIPLSADQPDNANKCVALGTARIVEPQALATSTIQAAALDLLRDPSYRESAQRQRDTMAAQPGVERAVELIEHVVLGRSPG